jgi:hypothetical protein
VFFDGGEPDHIAGTDLLDGAAFALGQPGAGATWISSAAALQIGSTVPSRIDIPGSFRE